MLDYLSSYSGSLEINGTEYPSVDKAREALTGFTGKLVIVLNREAKSSPRGVEAANSSISVEEGEAIYQIRVRQYMTRPSSPDFDFHDKWNGGTPMPMRIMVGKKLKETRGMVQMQLWAEITEEVTQVCMKCGRPLTNPVSRYFGIGPECGGHNYTNPFDSDEELRKAVGEVQTQLKEIKWTGWIIKSAIEEEKILRHE